MEIQPHQIVILHVGGSLGSYGPIDAVLRYFPRQSVVVVFEARECEEDRLMQSRLEANGAHTILVSACISEANGTSPFFINKHDESSSMLRPSPQALDEHIVGYSPPGVTTWRQNTEVDRTVTLNTITLGEFTEQQGIVPDVLSIDAQGMELRIMRGASNVLRHSNCVVSEVEFFEVYSGQGLFHEQMLLLDGYGFRLADLLNSQYWHPGPACGEGFFTVAEGLWFKKIDAFLKTSDKNHFLLRGIKLSALAFAFKRYSYAYALLKQLLKHDSATVPELCHTYGFEILLAMTSEVDNNLGNYAADNAFFVKHPLEVEHAANGSSTPGALRLFIGRAARRVARAMLRDSL